MFQNAVISILTTALSKSKFHEFSFDAAVALHQLRYTGSHLSSPEAPGIQNTTPEMYPISSNREILTSSPVTPLPEHARVAYPSQNFHHYASKTQTDREQSVSPSQGESCTQPAEAAADPEKMVGCLREMLTKLRYIIIYETKCATKSCMIK